MKKHIIGILLVLALVLSLAPLSLAESPEALNAAETLHKLGLFNGVDEVDGKVVYDLDRAPTRAEAVTMLIRFLGKDEESKYNDYSAPFTDVADWAKPYVNYAYYNGLTSGTSETTFGGSQTISASQYLTFVLRALGYESGKDFRWDSAWTLSDKIGLTGGEYNADTKSFLRGDVAIISNNALNAKVVSADKSLLNILSENQIIYPFGMRLVTFARYDGKLLSLELDQKLWDVGY